jgi:AGZA family xanthine/uracil permease-like MFS transporter
VLGAIAAFIIDRKFEAAAIYAGIGAVLAFFGFINGTQLAFGNSAPVALGYAILGGMLLLLWRRAPVRVAAPGEAATEGMVESV